MVLVKTDGLGLVEPMGGHGLPDVGSAGAGRPLQAGADQDVRGAPPPPRNR